LSELSPGNHKGTLAAIVGLTFIAILSSGFVGYASLNPHVVTVTEQQFLTNTQNQYFTQTVTSLSTSTSLSTTTTSAVSTYVVKTVVWYLGSGSYNCGAYGCSPPSLGAYGSLCQSTGQNDTVSCSGYLSEPDDGCIQLAIPYTNPYLLESTAYQFYTLRNVPSTLPPAGSWVAVTGQLGQGYTQGSNGAVCPDNYINVSTVSA
jgi:hypothetical protein